MAAEILDKETILLELSTAMKMPKEARPTCQDIPKNTPRPVATAFPPFQLSHIGHMCPDNAAIPQIT